MKRLWGLVFITMIMLLSSCSEETVKKEKKEDNELETFTEKYNVAVDNLEKNTDYEIDKLYEENFEAIEKQEDGYGYKQTLDSGRPDKTTMMYNVDCIYDNDKNIIGYEVFAISDPSNQYDDGSIEISDKGISTGFLIASALDLDIDIFNDYWSALMDSSSRVSYEENGYKVTMNYDSAVSNIAFKFMKTE